MERLRSRIPAYIVWVPPLVLCVAVVLDAVTPTAYTGTPLTVLACMVAAATATFRFTLAIVAASLIIALGSALIQPSPGDYASMNVVNVLVAAAIALDINRVLGRQTDKLTVVRTASEELQRAILPALPTLAGPVRVASRYEAADAAARIGGDLYAVQETPHGLRLIVADVRGKGLGAVSAVSVLIGAFRERAETEPDLGALAERLDHAMTRAGTQGTLGERPGFEEGFATALLAEIAPDGSTVRLLSCGHPAPYLVHNGTVRRLDSQENDLPLGMSYLSPGRSTPEVVEFPHDSTLLCVTDGVTEARDAEGAFYEPARDLHPLYPLSPDGLIDDLFESVHRWTDSVRHDDMAVLAVSRAYQ